MNEVSVNGFSLDKIDSAFPMESFREGQRSAVEYIINSFNNGKRIVIIECPTGGGKSAIGKTLMNMAKDSFYLTITKILQDQFTNDFDDVVELKGKNAYPCTFYARNGESLVSKRVMNQKDLDDKVSKVIDCTNGFCRSSVISSAINSSKNQCDLCFLKSPPSLKDVEVSVTKGSLTVLPNKMKYSACPYYEQVYKAIDSPQVIMNFSSFLYQTSLTRRFGKTRELLVVDEAHNIESQILDFVSFNINDSLLNTYQIFIPKLKTAKDYAIWFKEIELQNMLYGLMADYLKEGNTKEHDELEKLSQKLEIFMVNIEREDSEWVIEYNEYHEHNKTVRTITLKPVYAIGFVEDLLFRAGKKILLLSATILDVDVMARSLGLERSEIAAYRMKNRFPVKNRPIYVQPVARMTGGKDKMQEWLPKLITGVEKIMDKYPDQRGIIHTHNNAIMDAIVTRVKPKYFSRLVTQREFPDKRNMLQMHAKRSNSVIVAPAMHEGINLSDDLSRFQIICKVPYANFYENQQLARRVEVDPAYYQWMTAIRLVQSYGRSIRSETDFADTYIIDEAFIKFAKDAKKILPSWFLEALIYD